MKGGLKKSKGRKKKEKHQAGAPRAMTITDGGVIGGFPKESSFNTEKLRGNPGKGRTRP